MPLEQVKAALETVVDYPKMVGIMGGEPLLHPQFNEICEEATSKVPRERLGLWTCLPKGKEAYGPLIANTFGNIFINDHSRKDIYHAPILIGMREITLDMKRAWVEIDKCWVQNCWSASINPYGAYFCEVAASLALLFQEKEDAWPVTSDWWMKTPKDFTAQMERFCPRCGMAAPLSRRLSIEGFDDVSPLNAIALKGKSKKVDQGRVVVSTGKILEKPQQMASYKDLSYRQRIADSYGLHLRVTSQGFCEPLLGVAKKTLFDTYNEKWGQGVINE